MWSRCVPHLVAGFCTATHGAPYEIHKQQLRETKTKATDGRYKIPVSKLRIVIGNAARHTGQSQEMLWEEQHVYENGGEPEVSLRQCHVVHMTAPLRQPVIHRCHDGEDGA